MIRIARYKDLGLIVPLMKERFRNDPKWLLKRQCISSIMRETEDTLLYFDGLEVLGFAMVSLRKDHVDGSYFSPTGYLEALFVKPEFRNKKIALELMIEAEKWCLARDCKEMGSDVELDDKLSHTFHEKGGFTRLNTTVAYIKELEV